MPAAGAATGGREGSAALGSMFTRLSLTINHMCKLIWQTARDMKVVADGVLTRFKDGRTETFQVMARARLVLVSQRGKLHGRKSVPWPSMASGEFGELSRARGAS